MQTKSFWLKNLIAFFLAGAILLSFSACSAEKIDVKILDSYVTTELSASAGCTVEQALKKAEIILNTGDRVTPELNEKLSDGDTIVVERLVNVSVSYDGKKAAQLQLVGGTVKDAVESAGIKITDKTATNYDFDRYLSDGLQINVSVMSTVTLTADGKTKKYNTASKTLGEFFVENNISVSKHDRVSADLNEKIVDGMSVSIKRVVQKEETVTEKIEFKTVKKSSASLSTGKTKITQKGVNGEKTVTYKITYVDGEEESRDIIDEKIIKQPTDQIVLVGNKKKKSAEKSGKKIVSREYYDDCDGSGHGVCIITYDDGTTSQIEY